MHDVICNGNMIHDLKLLTYVDPKLLRVWKLWFYFVWNFLGFFAMFFDTST